MPWNPPQIIEFVSAKLKTGVRREDFLAGVRRSQSVLAQYPGFISRLLTHDTENDLWFDLVQWKDRADAEDAARSFMQDPNAAALIACLDEPTVTMQHYERQEGLCVHTAADTSAGCVELLTYRLKPGAGRERYERVVSDMSAMMADKPAFLRREVYNKPETGEWLETIYYRDRAGADEMFEQIKDAPCMHQCMELLDEPTLRMHFSAPVAWE